MNNFIQVFGARENNLQNISISIPKNKLIVFTGLSGSGKSTMAFDILQKECQRQYMESMGMITDLISKPKVYRIEGLSPSISIDQKNSNKNPRSTVGTITEISSYLRILYAKLGKRDGKEVEQLTMSHFSFNKPEGACPCCNGMGVTNQPDLSKIINMEKSIQNSAVLEWDKFYIDRYSESLESAGRHYGFDINTDVSVKEYNSIQTDLLLYGVLDDKFTRHFPDTSPPKTVSEGRFEGIITNLLRRYNETGKIGFSKQKLQKLFVQSVCSECNGDRLRKDMMDITVNGINIVELSKYSLLAVDEWIEKLSQAVSPEALVVATPIIDDLSQRVKRFIDAGVGYLSLERSAPTLSAGEAQRLRLASILGSGLTGVLYVLDEPTAGLHAKDTESLIEVLRRLRDLGNTVIVIEHDTDIMKSADYIIDFGPEAGKKGGCIMAEGIPAEISKVSGSYTAAVLAEPVANSVLNQRRAGNGKHISITGANKNNLKNINIDIPLGKLVAVTGASGSGKSTLVFDVLEQACKEKRPKENKGYHAISGLDFVHEVITINQSPIGRTPRSNAATYTDVYGDIRDLFASLPESKKRKLTARYFSFNTAGGRCEKCQGAGYLSVPMHFLPDVEVICPECEGKRFQDGILQVYYHNHNISDVLNLSIEEAAILFKDNKKIYEKLSVLLDVGLGYLGLGQPATTLSGGEAQRIKLAKELGKQGNGHILYLLDEPTTGLHPHDTKKIMRLFQQLVDSGNSVILIEHNLDVIIESDWIIDIGPDGGDMGGEIIAKGTPETIALAPNSFTGLCLTKRI